MTASPGRHAIGAAAVDFHFGASMLKLALGSYVAGVALLLLVVATGKLGWDNQLLWGPPVLFSLACALGLTGWDHDQHRVALLLLGAVAFCSVLAYAVFYFFLFGLVGH